MGDSKRERTVRFLTGVLALGLVCSSAVIIRALCVEQGNEPHVEVNAAADPRTIWVDTAPPAVQPKVSKITLGLVGAGIPSSTAKPLDTILLIDSSGSMSQNDPDDLRLDAAKHYVDLLSVPDRVAVVNFNTNAVLVGGDHLSSDYSHAKANIDTIGNQGYTDLFDPIRIATDELVANGDPNHVWLEILLTDGRDTTGHSSSKILEQASRAAGQGIVIYTIGLIGSGMVDEQLLRDIASTTGGVYLRATSADALDGIYQLVHRLVQGPDVAGYDNAINATLPDYLTYVAGSASPLPASADFAGGHWTLRWSLPILRINQTWNATFDVTSHLVGNGLAAFVTPETAVAYLGQDGQRATVPFPETLIDVLGNLPPVADAGPPQTGLEGSPITFDGSGSYDPNNDTLQYRWDFHDDGTWDTSWSLDPFATWTWGDDYEGDVTLEVTDGNFTSEAKTTVTVLNVPPSIADARAFMTANVTLRVAGEKWHDVVLRLYEDGNETASVRVIRTPGSPDDQSATVSGVEVSLSGSFWAVAYYTPDDDPINGQPNGANPTWITFHWEAGGETRIHHTFNVQHNDTWVWRVGNLPLYAVGQIVHLVAAASDPGSDDLSFSWDSGDARTLTTIVYSDRIGPDPYPSPDVKPTTAASEVTFVYPVAGTYTVTLTVTDDDGGSTSLALPLQVGA